MTGQGPQPALAGKAGEHLLVAGSRVPEEVSCVNGAPEGTPRHLSDDLVRFTVTTRKVAREAPLAAFAGSVAARYALMRGDGVARPMRPPEGAATLDAEVVVDDCRGHGMPTV